MGKGRILVVEDEGVVALDLQDRLRSLGYDVPLTVPTGEQAVAESKRLKPDLILMDVRLKGAKDGVEAAEEIRGVADVPVVFLTAYADEQTVARAKNAEPFGYLVKPFQEREISATIEVALFKHRIQRELRHRERWFSAILRSIGDAVIAADTTGKIAFLNPVAERLTGWPASVALGMNATEVFRVIDERSGEPLENPITAALRNNSDARLPRNALLLASNGETTPVDDSAALIRDEQGDNWGIVLTFRDIAERRQHERRLLESEQRFRAIFDSVQDAVLVCGLDGDHTDANLRACELLGHSREEFRKLGVEAWGLGAPPYARADAMRWIRKAANGHPQSFEWRTHQSTGQPLLLEVSLKRARIGGEARILATMHDITQRRLLQDQVARSQKLEAVGQLAGGVAHDFNNLLTVINGYTSLLLGQLRDDPEMAARAMQILSAGERAAALTRQLLTLARRQLVHPEQLDVNRLVTELSSMLQHTIREDIDCVFLTAKEPLYVTGDRTQIEQVVLNLVFNARDAMPAGGRLTIETRGVVLDERSDATGAVPPGHYVCLTVSDTGIGMDEKTRARLFEPFFTTKPPGKGTGLGLSTAYGIVKQSGGFILVDSEVNRGTAFTIYLPAIQAGPQQQAGGQKGTVAGAGSGKILLVEDDAGVRNLVSETLTNLGYSVIVARDAEEAIKLFDQHRDSIDMLLTDIVMPRMNGRDLAFHLQSQRPSLKVLFMSGYSDPARSRAGVAEPGPPLLRKPFTSEALGAKVRELLNQ